MGAKDLAFFSKYFDLVPLSVDAPWLFLVCWQAETTAQMCTSLSVKDTELSDESKKTKDFDSKKLQRWQYYSLFSASLHNSIVRFRTVRHWWVLILFSEWEGAIEADPEESLKPRDRIPLFQWHHGIRSSVVNETAGSDPAVFITPRDPSQKQVLAFIHCKGKP
jgi:hypothetical protein